MPPGGGDVALGLVELLSDELPPGQISKFLLTPQICPFLRTQEEKLYLQKRHFEQKMLVLNRLAKTPSKNPQEEQEHTLLSPPLLVCTDAWNADRRMYYDPRQEQFFTVDFDKFCVKRVEPYPNPDTTAHCVVYRKTLQEALDTMAPRRAAGWGVVSFSQGSWNQGF